MQHIEDVTRKKIFESQYWITKLFYANATTIVDLAVELEYFGGVFGAMGQPCDFLCLLLKLLVIKPETDMIQMFLESEHRYLRLLAACVVRLTAAPKDVYEYLEPLYLDYRKVAYKRADSSFVVMHVDECIEQLINDKQFCSIGLPPIVRRYKLEEGGVLAPRISPLQVELDEMAREGSSDSEKNKKKKKKEKKEKKRAKEERD
jgi:pre-mRNA-splicing factor 38A